MSENTMNCKGCGAPIGLAPGQTRGVCQFCGTPFTASSENLDVLRQEMQMQREDEKLRQSRQQLDLEQQKIDYERKKLEYEQNRFKAVNKSTKGCNSCSGCLGGCVGVFLLLAIFGSIIVYLFQEPIMNFLEEQITIAEMSQAKGSFYQNLESISKDDLDELNEKAMLLAEDAKGTLYGSWEYDETIEFAGNYLVSYNDGTGNELFCVFKTEYKNDTEELYYTVYKCYRYKNIYETESGTMKAPEKPDDLNTDKVQLKDESKKKSTVYGFFELSEIYDQYIASIEKSNALSSSGIVYVPDQKSSDVKSQEENA